MRDLVLQGADMMRFVKVAATAALTFGLLSACAAPADPEAQRLAAEIPIFDMHLHVYPGLSPQRLEAAMDRNGVRWGGGVGSTVHFVDIQSFRDVLPGRYFPTLGQGQMAASYSQGGVAAMSSEDNAFMRAAIEMGPDLLSARRAFGYGELILNNQNSSANPQFRRRAQVDSPVVRKMFSVVSEHGGIIQMHVEPDSTSLSELRNLLRDFPRVPVVLSHCLVLTTSPREVEALFDASPQVHCELSFRSQTTLARLPAAQVYGFDFAKSDWVSSIEKYSDRYMVGTDVSSNSISYDDEVKQIRTGLLARLKSDTARKVANGNAKRLMKVTD